MKDAPNFLASHRYLKKDARLGAFVREYGPIAFRREHAMSPFQALAESIIYQQLSGKAAAAILKKFIALYPGKKFPTLGDVLKTRDAKLRSAGLSGQKAAYLKDLACKFKDGTVSPKRFSKMSDEEIIEHITAVKGIGRWTAHMFLMFTLHRSDVLPVGDLGIQKGFKKLFNLKKLPSPEQMERLARAWEGHRTLASFYLWRYVDGGGIE